MQSRQIAANLNSEAEFSKFLPEQQTSVCNTGTPEVTQYAHLTPPHVTRNTVQSAERVLKPNQGMCAGKHKTLPVVAERDRNGLAELLEGPSTLGRTTAAKFHHELPVDSVSVQSSI